jgi:hypothetical protein
MNWIKWNGKDFPAGKIPPGLTIWDRVEILTRSGDRNEGYADNFVWGHFDTELDILFYRVTEKWEPKKD